MFRSAVMHSPHEYSRNLQLCKRRVGQTFFRESVRVWQISRPDYLRVWSVVFGEWNVTFSGCGYLAVDCVHALHQEQESQICRKFFRGVPQLVISLIENALLRQPETEKRHLQTI